MVETITILGTGPAGLVAAEATHLARPDAYVQIFSRGEKSPLYGAQYLHKPIMGVTDPKAETRISYGLRGSVEEYARKIYGNSVAASEASPSVLAESHPGWDIRSTYDELWKRWHPGIIPREFSFNFLEALWDSGGMVLNTAPLPALCMHPEHVFESTTIWAAGDAPELDRYAPVVADLEPGQVICDGNPDVPWYRTSLIFGYRTVEWTADRPQPVRGAALVRKPIRHNCGCFPGWGQFGRYGSWKKGKLVHHVYDDVLEYLKERRG